MNEFEKDYLPDEKKIEQKDQKKKKLIVLMIIAVLLAVVSFIMLEVYPAPPSYIGYEALKEFPKYLTVRLIGWAGSVIAVPAVICLIGELIHTSKKTRDTVLVYLFSFLIAVFAVDYTSVLRSTLCEPLENSTSLDFIYDIKYISACKQDLEENQTVKVTIKEFDVERDKKTAWSHGRHGRGRPYTAAVVTYLNQSWNTGEDFIISNADDFNYIRQLEKDCGYRCNYEIEFYKNTKIIKGITPIPASEDEIKEREWNLEHFGHQ